MPLKYPERKIHPLHKVILKNNPCLTSIYRFLHNNSSHQNIKTNSEETDCPIPYIIVSKKQFKELPLLCNYFEYVKNTNLKKKYCENMEINNELSLKEYINILLLEREKDGNLIFHYYNKQDVELKNMSTIEFCKWHSTFVCQMMNHIELYRKFDDQYIFPQNLFENGKYVINLKTMKNDDLEDALRFLFLRMVLFYALRFSSHIENRNFKKVLVILSKELKFDVEQISNEMNERNIKLLNLLDKYEKYYKYTKQISSGNYLHLRHILGEKDELYECMILSGEEYLINIILGKHNKLFKVKSFTV